MAPREGDAGSVIGNVGAAHDLAVDRRGAVTLGDPGLSLAWWVGAADGWHRPADEPRTAVTQRLVDGVPVVETSMRVPRGQVVHRAWCTAGPDGGDAVVFEVENRSQEPVAVAVVVRHAGRLAFDGDRTLSVDGRPGAVLGRRPARAATGDEPQVLAALEGGEGRSAAPFDVRRSTAALVFPVAHTASLRVALPLAAAVEPSDVDRLADHEAVVRGWRQHIDAGARVAVPDEALATSITSARATLLLRAGLPRSPRAATRVVAALDAWGHHDLAADASRPLLDVRRFGHRREPERVAAALAALGAHARATGDAAWAEPFVEPVARAAHRLGRRWAVAQADAADVLDAAGQPEAAALCRERIDGTGAVAVVAAATPTLDALRALAALSGGRDDSASADFLLAARARLVDDADPVELRLLPVFADEWLGREVEAHRLPTRAGLLSFALRWHGPRPALLWERQGDRAARLRCPGLDPAWSSDDPAGEALLGLVEPAGGLPKVVAPLGAGTGAADAPDEGTSFR